jgi:hypothetical protein
LFCIIVYYQSVWALCQYLFIAFIRIVVLVFISSLARKVLLVFIHSVALSVKLPLSAPIQNNKVESENFRHGPHAGHTTALSFPDRQGYELLARSGLGTI